MTNIYEACNFQDIIRDGKIGKVVRTLKQIEAKVAGLVEAFGDEAIDQVAASSPGLVESTAATGQQDADSGLLNGPQLPRRRQFARDIDALFGSD